MDRKIGVVAILTGPMKVDGKHDGVYLVGHSSRDLRPVLISESKVLRREVERLLVEEAPAARRAAMAKLLEVINSPN